MYEKEIIKLLKKRKKPLGIYEIMEELTKMKKERVSYSTVKMTLKDMVISGEISGKSIGKKQRTTWVFWLW